MLERTVRSAFVMCRSNGIIFLPDMAAVVRDTDNFK